MLEKKKTQLGLSVTEICYNCCFASAYFLSVFLQSLGISVGQIGLITSLTNAMGIVSQPFWGAVSDRLQSVRRSFILCIGLSSIFAVSIPMLAKSGSSHYLVTMIPLVSLYFFLMPANMLIEMWLVQVNANTALGISYGSIRIWASIGYALMNLAYVPILKRLPVRFIYYFYAAFALLAAGAAYSVLKGSGTGTAEHKERKRIRDMQFRKILTYGTGTYLVFEILLQIPLEWSNTYTVFLLNARGLKSVSYGLFTFLSGICEVPMLLMCKRLIRRRGLVPLLVASAMLFTAQHLIYAFGRTLFALLFCQVLKGFAIAMYVTCRHQYIYNIAPEGLKGSTMAMINAAYAGANILAAAVGGYILESLGVNRFFALIASIQFFAALFLTGTTRFRKSRSV